MVDTRHRDTSDKEDRKKSHAMLVPLPSFTWAKGAEVWDSMMEKDAAYHMLRSDKMLERHPSLVDSYRTILFDWLSEVSHECKFHRETYHLALDLIDRYLTAQSNVGKLQLQLIGTTCLFLAAKIEEVRPPTVIEFAELTDGACRPEEIIDNEVVILSAINWDMTPITPNNWLSVYMQILLNLDKENDIQSSLTNKKITRDGTRAKTHAEPDLIIAQADENSQSTDSSSLTPARLTSNAQNQTLVKNDSFILPTNNGLVTTCHKRIASVIDLALLHIQTLRFSNSILTASALYHFTDEITVRQCTGYEYGDLAECVRWLRPFVETIKEIRNPVFLDSPLSMEGESHPTQMHVHIATAKLLEKVTSKIEADDAAAVTSTTGTPCRSLKRKAHVLRDEEIIGSENDILSMTPSSHSFLPTPPHSAEKRRPRPVH